MATQLAPCLSVPLSHREDDIAARLPRELAPLARLAMNLWWSWQPRAGELFRAIDPARWEATGNNPVKLLRDTSGARLAAAAGNAALIASVRELDAALERDLSRPFAWPEVATVEHPIAFFCAEYGLHGSLPIYSGGLGVLAGDFLKQASDSALPMVAVGLYYRRGFFRQRLDRSGWQHEYWTESTAEELPMRLELDDAGAPRVVHVEIRGRQVAACIWHVQVGRVPLFLLDTNLPENDPVGRFISSTLYVGDRAFRLMQYAMLAIGGVRALRAMGIDPKLVHLNEGHAALATLELIREGRTRGLHFEEALGAARKRVVFTTHTPVPAGNEHYSMAEIDEVLGSLPAALNVEHDQLFALGRPTSGDEPPTQLGVTELALRTSRSANGVSRAHGEVARAMWQHLWPGRAPDVPIGHVTNGVHLPTWMAPPMRALLDRHLGSGWETRDDAATWARLDAIPDEELWAVRTQLRGSLVEHVRTKTIADRLARGESIAYAEGAAMTFDPSVLTLGFARRVAAYKRMHLLIQDPRRALALLHGPRRIQVVIAGKAHPMDDAAKYAVQRIFAMKDVELAATHVAFLEDYDLATAAQLVAGCDLWVSLPRPPLEASGTSGMKAGLNGSINVAVLDGYWPEAFEQGQNGWAIASENTAADEGAQDVRDAETVYGLIENEVVPAFYDRDEQGLPRAWIRRMRASLRTMATRFTTRRMLREYVERVYRT